MLSYKQYLEEAFTSADSKLAKKTKLPSGLLVVPRTHESCRKYGMNTKWCITQNEPNYWNGYIGDQNLTPYIFIPNNEYLEKLIKFVGNDKTDLSKIIIMIDKGNQIKHVWDAKDINLTTELGINKCLEIIKMAGIDKNSLVSLEVEPTEDSFVFNYKIWRGVLDKLQDIMSDYGLGHLFDLLVSEDVYDVAKKTFDYYIKQGDFTFEGVDKAIERSEYDLDYIGPNKDSKSFFRLFERAMGEVIKLKDEDRNKTPVKLKE